MPQKYSNNLNYYIQDEIKIWLSSAVSALKKKKADFACCITNHRFFLDSCRHCEAIFHTWAQICLKGLFFIVYAFFGSVRIDDKASAMGKIFRKCFFPSINFKEQQSKIVTTFLMPLNTAYCSELLKKQGKNYPYFIQRLSKMCYCTCQWKSITTDLSVVVLFLGLPRLWPNSKWMD